MIDVGGMVCIVVVVVVGLCDFGEGVNVVGVIFNCVGSVCYVEFCVEVFI